jgi:hypothetical protein
MITPNENKSKVGGAIGIIVIVTIMLAIGAQITSVMVNSMPPKEFKVVDKAHFPAVYVFANLKWSDEQFRLYYNHDTNTGYIPVNQTTYDRYRIGDWFNETVTFVVW